MTAPRLALIGAGNMAQRAHIRTYSALAREGLCRIEGILDTRPQLAKMVADAYHIEKVFDNLDEILTDPKIDGIIAILPYRQHIFAVPQLLTKAVPIFTEKPIALSVDGGERLAQLGEKHHVKHMVGYHKRSDLAVKHTQSLIQEWLTSGAFGTLKYVRISMPPGDWTFSSLPSLTTDETVSYGEQDTPTDIKEDSLLEYDAFVNYYIHQVNLIRFLLGEPYHVTFVDSLGVLMCGESDHGASVVLEMAPFQMREGWWEHVLIGFERAFIEINLPAPLAEVSGQIRIVTDTSGKVLEECPIFAPVSAMRQQAMTFLEVIQGNIRPPCDAREAIEDLKIARAIFDFREKSKRLESTVVQH